MDFNAWASKVIESALSDSSGPTTLHINPSRVGFQIQSVAPTDPPTTSGAAHIYPHSRMCLSVMFWHPAPDTTQTIPIASYPCLTGDGLFPTAENILAMVHEVVLAIDVQYGERQAVLAKEKLKS